MMSASVSDVGRYVVLMAFRLQISQTKWKRTLMCLVRSWNFGFFTSWIASCLSTKICWGSVALESLSEHKQWRHCSACLYRILPYNMRAYKEQTQMASFVASEASMYSPSIFEKATSGCLQARQIMAPPASMNTQPDVDFRSSGSPAKSESV